MRFILPLLLLLCFEGPAQVWHMKRYIKWNHSAKESELDSFISFPGSAIQNISEVFPYYFELVEWKSEDTQLIPNILILESEEFQGYLSSPQKAMLHDSATIKVSINYSTLRSYLQLTVSPFFISRSSGRLFRIKSFIVQLEAKPSVQTSKKSSATASRKSSLDQNSVLAGGKWYKIRVSNTGIYRLTFEQIKSMGFEDPGKVRIFGNGGNLLPEDYRLGSKDELLPTQIQMVKGADNVFNQGDYLLFFALGPVSWKFDEYYGLFRQKNNYYSNFGYYFITSDNSGPDFPGSGDPNPPEAPNYLSNSYDSYTFHESEDKSFKNDLSGMRTGKEWFGENFTYIPEQSFMLTLNGLLKTNPVRILTQVLARSKDSSSFYLSYNNINIDTLYIRSTDVTDYTAPAAFTSTGTTSLLVADENIALKLKFNKREGNAMGWIDFITINGRSELRLMNDFLIFRDKNTVASNRVTSFRVSSADNKVFAWDITDPNNILKFSTSLAGSELSFITKTDRLKEFVVFRENGNFPSPEITGEGLGLIDNQDLHGLGYPDLIILSHTDFLVAANRLAVHRRDFNGLEVAVLTPEQVFNEFSSGNPDVTAIRNFVKYLYEKAAGDPLKIPRYLLLFGDGSYDNKRIDPNATNFILTYQSDNSTSPVSSFVSDDYFALLDPGEAMTDGLLDIGVGRLPLKSVVEADDMVTKIIDYEKPDRMGDWRNRVSFIGDDEDGNIHMAQADQLANYVRFNYPDINVGKIFLDAYMQVSSPSGQKYPDVNIAINDQVGRGALIINYTGHGGVKGLAHEQVVTLQDIRNWKNKLHLPLFMTATCEFSRFDEHEILTAGEEVLLNKNGGGIALFSTTRLVYSGPNHSLNEKFYQVVFEKNASNEYNRLGDIMKYSKNNSGSGINKRNFTLLGDPSMMLAYPEERVVTDSVNGKNISVTGDTLRALQEVSISGHISDTNGSLLESFNGTVYPLVYDKEMPQSTMGNDGGQPKSYIIRNNILFKGKVSVNSGKFNFSFRIPKDINYAFDNGKISYYAADSAMDASGSFNDVVIGGSDPGVAPDQSGPEVEVFMNDTFFISGGITDENPVLLVRVFDESGINTSGNGIGHNITGYLDGSTQKTQSLNEFYQSDLNSYQSGEIIYQLSEIEEGWHTLIIKVWDIFNNSGEGFTDFMVVKGDELVLDQLMNFPNPFNESTSFSFGHNKTGSPIDITIEIFNMNGQHIRTLKASDDGTGFRSEPLSWDGTSDSGSINGQGLYIYRIRIISSDGSEAVNSGKLIKLR